MTDLLTINYLPILVCRARMTDTLDPAACRVTMRTTRQSIKNNLRLMDACCGYLQAHHARLPGAYIVRP